MNNQVRDPEVKTFFSEAWSDDFNNTPGKFITPLPESIILGEHSKVGLKFMSTSPGFFNLNTPERIRIFTSTDGHTFKFVTALDIDAGYYHDLQFLVKHITAKLATVPQLTHLKDVPYFEIMKDVETDENRICFYPTTFTHYYHDEEGVSHSENLTVVLELSKMFVDILGFTETTLESQFGERRVTASKKPNFATEEKHLQLWCDWCEEPLLQFTTGKLIVNIDKIKFAKIRSDQMKKPIDSVMFWFTDMNDEDIGKDFGEVMLSVYMKQ
jgi:hypothetical protein